MAALRKITLEWEIATGSLRASTSYLKRNELVDLRAVIKNEGDAYALPTNWGLNQTIKPAGEGDADALVIITDWTADTETGVYLATAQLIGSTELDAFLLVNADSSDDVTSLNVDFDLCYTVASVMQAKSDTVTVALKPDIGRSNDAEPTEMLTRNDFFVSNGSGLLVNVAAGYLSTGAYVAAQTSISISNGTNYVQLNSSGVASSNQSGFTDGYYPLAVVVASAGAITSNSDRRAWLDIKGGGGSSSLTVGTTAITGGTSGRLLTNNGNVLGEISTSGLGSVALTNSPEFTTPILGTPQSGVLTNCTGTATGLTAGNATVAAQFVVANEASATACYPLFSTASTGSVEAKSNSTLLFDSANSVLSVVGASGGFVTTGDSTFVAVYDTAQSANTQIRPGAIQITPVGGATTTLTVNSGGATIAFPGVSGTVITTGDTGTVTNAMLAGSITLSKLTGLGTGVATALAVNTGNSGAFVVNGGALGTPSSGTLTNCTFPTLNQNTTGSAASLSVSGQTGLITFTGITATNRAKTVRDAADTILELGGSYTPTGTWTSMALTSPAVTTSLTTPSATFALANTTATTVNAFGAATTLNIGASTGTCTIANATVTLSNCTALNISGAGTTITGGAGNMTIVAGTGASRTMAFQTTTSGGTATNAITISAAQVVAMLAGVASTSSTTGTLVVTGGIGVSGSIYSGGSFNSSSSTAGTFAGMIGTNTSTASNATSVLRAVNNSGKVCEFGLGGSGHSTFSADGYFYTDQTNLDFYAGAARRMRVAAGVVIGGTTDPGAGNLSVTGTVGVAGVTTLTNATATPVGGSTSARTLMGTTAGFGIYYGSGAPTVSAGKGSLYLRSDGGGINDRMYVNTDGGTTWTAVVTVA